MSTKSKTPKYYAYVIEKNGDDSYWTKIGAAWENGKVINIKLNSVPLSGEIILSRPKEK